MTDHGGEGSPTSSLAKSDAMMVKSPGDDSPNPDSRPSPPPEAEVGSTAGGYLLLGAAHVLLGVAMAALGAMALVHEAAMSGAGAGLWGGAVAMAAGAAGLTAGLRGCYSPRGRVPAAFASAFLALCLVALAVANLVVVLTVTGIVRDGQKPDTEITVQDGAEARQVIQLNWAHILTNCGLLVASFSECVVAVVSGYRCYRRACPCTRRLPATDTSGSFYSTASKEMLVSSWLGGSPSTLSTLRRQDGGVLLVPPHTLPHPVYVFPPPPPPPPPPTSSLKSYLPSTTGGRYINPLGQPRYAMRTPSHLRHLAVHGGKKGRNHEERHRRRRRESRDASRASPEKEQPVTEEEVAKTYTGMDREIAEEFIAIAMDPGAMRSKHGTSSTDDTATMSDLGDKQGRCH